MYSIHDFVYTSLYFLVLKKYCNRLHTTCRGLEIQLFLSLEIMERSRAHLGPVGLKLPQDLWLELSSTEL